MYCPSCGTEIDDNTQYCPQCGQQIQHQPNPQQRQQSQQQNSQQRQQHPQQQQAQQHQGRHPPQNQTQPQGETAPCDECDSYISTDANRCPYCGYEPSDVSTLFNIITVIAVPWVIISVFLIIDRISKYTSGTYTVGQFLTQFAIILIPAGLAVGIIAGRYKRAYMGPTNTGEEPLSELK